MQVKYLPEKTIEAEVQTLLAECGVTEPPIPVDDILENHLGFSLDLDDLCRRLGVGDALGAAYLDTRQVFIDQSLDPYEDPDMEGRYHFTVAHEIGHVRLHSQYLSGAMTRPSIICRQSEARERGELQANLFAASLLMPKSMVLEALRNCRGKTHVILFGDVRAAVREWVARWEDAPGALEHCLGARVSSRYLSPIFRVSIQAMWIRLNKLGLVHEGEPRSLTFCKDCG